MHRQVTFPTMRQPLHKQGFPLSISPCAWLSYSPCAGLSIPACDCMLHCLKFETDPDLGDLPRTLALGRARDYARPGWLSEDLSLGLGFRGFCGSYGVFGNHNKGFRFQTLILIAGFQPSHHGILGFPSCTHSGDPARWTRTHAINARLDRIL